MNDEPDVNTFRLLKEIVTAADARKSKYILCSAYLPASIRRRIESRSERYEFIHPFQLQEYYMASNLSDTVVSLVIYLGPLCGIPVD